MIVNASALPSDANQRGPRDHDMRSQIIDAANEYFRHYGYGKTTVSDLARSIGVSKAYIYKFFVSKQEIGEAICRQHLLVVSQNVSAAVEETSNAAEKVRILFSMTLSESLSLFFTDRKLHDMCAHAVLERWAPPLEYENRVADLIQKIVKEGRRAGEFERKTPVDEVARAIFCILEPFMNALLLQYRIDDAEKACADVVGLGLRSLAP